jgi:hypothetical protein
MFQDSNRLLENSFHFATLKKQVASISKHKHYLLFFRSSIAEQQKIEGHMHLTVTESLQ